MRCWTPAALLALGAVMACGGSSTTSIEPNEGEKVATSQPGPLAPAPPTATLTPPTSTPVPTPTSTQAPPPTLPPGLSSDPRSELGCTLLRALGDEAGESQHFEVLEAVLGLDPFDLYAREMVQGLRTGDPLRYQSAALALRELCDVVFPN